MKNRIARRLYDVLELTSSSDLLSRLFNIIMMVLICINVIAVMLETVREFEKAYSQWLKAFEIISISIFTLEYIARVLVCTQSPRYRSPILDRAKYIVSPMAIVDLLAILPFYLPLLIPFDLRFFRAIRLFRIFRLFKLGRYSESLRTLGSVVKEKWTEISVTLIVVMVLLVISSSLMYYVEEAAQPKVFSSIPASMWWGVVTLTTVGYGDVYPVTSLGRVLGAFIALLGIGVFALPAGIFASGFAEAVRRKRRVLCPHCGKAIEE